MRLDQRFASRILSSGWFRQLSATLKCRLPDAIRLRVEGRASLWRYDNPRPTGRFEDHDEYPFQSYWVGKPSEKSFKTNAMAKRQPTLASSRRVEFILSVYMTG
jgi:hypothetical protein